MSIPIRIIPDPVLREKAQPVSAVDKRVAKFMEEMLESMYTHHGIGLAANQVGSLERVITVDVSEERNGTKALMMANPEIIWHDPEATFTYKEGCLSIPDQYAEVTRPKRIRLTYLDRSGKKQEMEAEDLLSQCIQHEIDHLNGVLFIDYLSKLKRGMIERKVEKAQRAKADDEHIL
ncbi:MAG TPA: peptide deformylase [Alphaproteobacteria bacterium]|nr:peptide deformylase [Alphaproteobacteria bacterium]